MITKLLAEAYYRDVELWTENGKLRYRAQAGALTPELKQQLIDNKDPLIKRLDQNKTAHAGGWLTFDFGEAYNRRTGERSEMLILRTADDTFSVSRASWRSGEPKALYEKTIADRVSFEDAMKRADNYLNWSSNKSSRRRAG